MTNQGPFYHTQYSHALKKVIPIPQEEMGMVLLNFFKGKDTGNVHEAALLPYSSGHN